MVPPLPPPSPLPALLPCVFAARPERGPPCERCHGSGTASNCNRESPCKRCVRQGKMEDCVYVVPDKPKLPACEGCVGRAGFGVAKCDREVRCIKCMERGIECERDAPCDPAAPPPFRKLTRVRMSRVCGRLADFAGAGDGRDCASHSDERSAASSVRGHLAVCAPARH
jgi:hypothetical protein